MSTRFSARLESDDFSCEDVEISSISGREAISQLSVFDVEFAVPEASELDPETLVGCSVTLIIDDREATEPRRFRGVIVELFDRLDALGTHRFYQVRIMPRAFRLTLIRTQEVFLNLSVPEIIRKKFALVGLTGGDVEFRFNENYPLREFVVQFDETDLAFISRLCENIGISFFFEHHGDTDKIVFTDHQPGFHESPILPKARFLPDGSRNVSALRLATKAIPAAYVVQDYNYRSPRLELTGRTRSELGLGGGTVEFGSHHKSPEEGLQLAKIRTEELEAHHRVFTGASKIPDFYPGSTFTLEDHPRLGDAPLLLTEVEHIAKFAAALGRNSSASETEATYANTFRAISRNVTYRPPRVTPKPKIAGILTALVQPDPSTVGIGNVSKLDEDGRYTVKFFFDTASDEERDLSSRRIRMLQPHSGPGYGVHFPLKPGVEVAIVFVGGDPDRPVIAGAMPNALTPAPVTGKNPLVNRIKTSSGISVTMKDGWR